MLSNLPPHLRKQLLWVFSPVLLLILYPFHISWGIFYERLEKYGTLDNYILVFVSVFCLFLGLDFYIRNRSFFKNKLDMPLFWLGSVLVSLLLRYFLLDYKSPDYVEALSLWYDFIAENGGFSALKHRGFSDYNASYLYLMAFLSYLPIHKLYAIKLSSIVFDYVAAFWVYKIVKLNYPKRNFGVLAFVFVIFAPTVVINSSYWAQCDVIYTSFLLMTTYFFLKFSENIQNSRPKYIAIIAFGIALAWKLQAVFFVLPLLYLYLKTYVRWYEFLLVLLVLFMVILPNYFLGRPFMDLVLIYGHQILDYPRLSLNAPTIYNLLPGLPYSFFIKTGIVMTFGVVFGFSILFLRKNIPFSKHTFLKICLLSLLIIPYLLPKMHERYFFAADIFAIVYAFYNPKKWFVPLIVGAISLFSYAGFLFEPPFSFIWLALVLGVLILYLLVEVVRCSFKK